MANGGKVTVSSRAGGVALHPVDEHLSVRLRQLRQKARLSQAGLAERVNLSPGMIHWYEVGESRISASTLFDLAIALGCTVADFYAGLDGDTASDVEPGRAPLAAMLDTRSGALLAEAYSQVGEDLQDQIAILAQILANDARAAA